MCMKLCLLNANLAFEEVPHQLTKLGQLKTIFFAESISLQRSNPVFLGLQTLSGFLNLASARHKSPATSSSCAGYFWHSKFHQYTILFHVIVI